MARKPLRDRSRQERSGALACYELDWSDPANMDEGELEAFVHAQYEDGKQRRSKWEAEAAECLAWARGNQHLLWNGDVQDLREVDLAAFPLWLREPVHINKLRGFILSALAYYVGAPLTWQVDPSTREDDDVASARVSTKVARAYWERTGESESGMTQMIHAAYMLACTGVVFAKVTWDPHLLGGQEAQRYGPDVLEDAVAEGTDGESASVRERFSKWVDWVKQHRGKRPSKKEKERGYIEQPAGDLAMEWVSGFDITEPVHARNVPESLFLLHSRFRSMEYLRARYGDVVDELEPDGNSEAYRYRYQEQYGNAEHASNIAPDEVLTHEIWRPICDGAPQGFVGVVAQNVVLKKGPHPQLHGRYPFVRFCSEPEPEYFRPTSTIRDLMSLAKARNKQRSYVHGHLHATCDPLILREPRAGFPDGAVTQTGKGKVVDIKDGGMDGVKAFEMPDPPTYMQQLDDMNLRDMEDVAGLHKSSTGRAESAQQSGKHAEILAAGDAHRQKAGRLLFQESAAATGQLILLVLWENVSEERIIALTGESGAREVVKFKGKDLSTRQRPIGPWAFNVKAHLAPIEDMSQTLAKTDLLFKYGVFQPGNERHLQIVLRWLGEHVPGQTDEWSEHRARAADENWALLEGKPVDVAYGDMDQVHIAEHERFTTTQEYKSLKHQPVGANQEGPVTLEMAMLTHIREHIFNEADKRLRVEMINQKRSIELAAEYQLLPAMGPGPNGQGLAAGPGGQQPGGRPGQGASNGGQRAAGGGGPDGRGAGRNQPNARPPAGPQPGGAARGRGVVGVGQR